MVNAVQYFATVKRIGGMASMLWRGSTGVVQNEPLMRRMALFCATCKDWMRRFRAWYDHKGKPYRRTGRVMA